MPDNREMAGKVLREKKGKGEKVTGMVTIIPDEPGKPAYRLGITSVKTIAGPKITKEVKHGNTSN